MAIPLPDPVRDALATLQDAIPVGRCTPWENLHLTLSFLGELTEAEAAEVHSALADVSTEGFEIALRGLDLFGGKQPQILFVGLVPCPPLVTLQRRVVASLRGAGLALRRERFRPHVTLARFNRALRRDEEARLAAFLQANGGFAAAPFEAERFTLFRSDLGNGPARHTALASYPLTPTGD